MECLLRLWNVMGNMRRLLKINVNFSKKKKNTKKKQGQNCMMYTVVFAE